jgi:bacterioferritin-associated ferredoxin
MIVCLCHGVNDRTIRACVKDGAGSVQEVGRRCGAGTDCGSCRRSIRELIREHDVEQAQSAGAACSSSLLPIMASHAG